MSTSITASEFINSIEFPVIFIVGNGCPGGHAIAYFEETELPFDLDDVEGTVTDGVFEATNLKDGHGVWDWAFHDFSGNIIYTIRIDSDEEVWTREVIDYATSEGINDESRSYCEDLGIPSETFDEITGYTPKEMN